MRTVPATPPPSSYTGLSQTNAVGISDIQQAFERNPLPPHEVAFLRELGIEVPEDPNHLEAFLRDVARILGPTQSDLDDQLGNDPAEPHSHEHEGDTLMDDSRNHVVRWDSHMAFGGTSLDLGFPALGGDAEKQPIQQTNNVGASTSASSGVSKAPPKARTAGRSIFGGGSDNPAHRYICETCRKEGYAKCRFRRQDSLDRHQARHIGIYESKCPYCNKGISREDNAFDHFQNAHREHFQRADCERSQHDHHTRKKQRICLACPKCGENWKQTRKERKGMRKDPSLTDLGRHLIDTESECYGSLKDLFRRVPGTRNRPVRCLDADSTPNPQSYVDDDQ